MASNMPVYLRASRKIAVVGAGIIGLTSAVRILEEIKDVEVTLIAKDVSPDTTGDLSAGFWKPYLLGDVPQDVIKKWLDESFEFFVQLTKTPDAGEIGVGLLSVFDLAPSEDKSSSGAEQMFGYRKLSENELRSVSESNEENKISGAFYTSCYAQCNLFLPYLLRRFLNQGGILIRDEVENFEDLFVGRFDAIVNCTGISSSKIASDCTVYPIRGQIIRVKAPWIKHAITNAKFHALPCTDYVQLGGTAQINDWNLTVDPEDTQYILEGCCQMVPSLKKAEVIEVGVGLRPSRKAGPRVEADVLESSDGSLSVPIIHNYGHGGSGVTLSWGCAGTVISLLNNALS